MKFAKYIVLTEDKTEMRFFAIGTVDKNDAFTGIMHDYSSGNYEERIATHDTSYNTKITLYELSVLGSGNALEEVELHKERANRTLHGLKNGLAYYNYEGVHFRVFNSFKDGMFWLDTRNDNLVIAEFENEQGLDSYLGAKS